MAVPEALMWTPPTSPTTPDPLNLTTQTTLARQTTPALPPDPLYIALRRFFAIHLPICTACIGLLGNVLILLVLRSYRRTSSATFLLKTLAAVDLCFLVFYILSEWAMAIYWNGFRVAQSEAEVYYILVIMYLSLVKRFFEFLTVWIVVIVTLDRFVQIRRPLDHIQPNPHRRARLAVLAMFIAGIPLTGAKYYFIAYKVHYHEGRAAWVEETIRHGDVIIVFDVIFFCLLPLLVIIPFNLANVVLLRKTFKNDDLRPNSTFSAAAMLDKSTRMTITVVVLFVVLKVPMAVDLLGSMFVPEIHNSTKTGLIIWLVVRFLSVLNCAVNIAIYFFVGQEFRKKFKSLFQRFSSRFSKRHDRRTSELSLVNRPRRQSELSNGSANVNLSNVSFANNNGTAGKYLQNGTTGVGTGENGLHQTVSSLSIA